MKYIEENKGEHFDELIKENQNKIKEKDTKTIEKN